MKGFYRGRGILEKTIGEDQKKKMSGVGHG